MTQKKIILFIILFFAQFILVTTAVCKEAKVFYVDITDNRQNDLEEIKLACDLLGIRLEIYYLNTTNDIDIQNSIKKLYDNDVLILSNRVLRYFNKDNILLFGRGTRTTKILISDIHSTPADIHYLKLWSKNNIKGGQEQLLTTSATSIRVTENKQIVRELGGLEYPLMGSGSAMINGFELKDVAVAGDLIEVIDESSKIKFPIFFTTESKGLKVFYLSSWREIVANETNELLRIMPFLIFLKYSFSDRCWHGISDFANLTIDDPWLREPYGYISFAELCNTAKKTPFHATLGFIPYNYAKSNNEAIEIFKQCSKQLSIAVHGNNHDFLEFRNNLNDRFDEKNVLQAIYRMDAFKQKTGIPYDPVMIFPRGVFTKESLKLLKKQNFLMTINSTSPLQEGDWKKSVDRLRGITLEYENFPIALRSGISDWKKNKHSESIEKSRIQMRLFLDLPVLLYTHQGFFKDGADAFNTIAETINKLQPEVVWTGLGGIAKKYYLQKRTDDRVIEILSYSSELVIKNNYDVTMKYIVRKQEDFSVPIESVEVSGLKQEYFRDPNFIRLEVLIEPGREKNIRVRYHSDNNIENMDNLDNDFKVTLVRTLSDFRDLYLSKLPYGDKVVAILYTLGSVGKVLLFIIGGLIATFLILLVWYIKKVASKKKYLSK
ncbi:MAG: hypothetical protein WCJ37_00125 [Syntrophus sp. (in: bacteria)]